MNDAPVFPTLLTRKEAAPALRISVRALDNLTKKRIIPCYRLGGKVLYRLDRVMAALDARTEETEDKPQA